MQCRKQPRPLSLKPSRALSNAENINIRQYNIRITISNVFWSRTIRFCYVIGGMQGQHRTFRLTSKASEQDWGFSFYDGYLISVKPYPKELLEWLREQLESPGVIFCSCSDITNIVQDKGYLISTTTLRRWYSEVGLGSYVAAAKPGLHAENITKELKWAIKYKDWTAEDWKRVIWSDESSV